MWIVGIILNMVVMTGVAPTATLPTAPELGSAIQVMLASNRGCATC
jgi:hypothetical protein